MYLVCPIIYEVEQYLRHCLMHHALPGECGVLFKQCLFSSLQYLEFTQIRSINLQDNMASCSELMWSLFWLIVLFFIGWPLSIFFGGIYGFLSPLTTCIGLDQVTDVLLQGANLGRTCAENMRSSKALC
ncbi:hypothetical protein scyTo_0004675 [Scyliorhinus torazame]|uniref:Uncharacterized protein n=1 Tax=Scyliorhinus torazame TaxID=75743 RepID=A0A401NVA7_SCYTO|nr:hypothetical protein [Scyliorhinus torazame]